MPINVSDILEAYLIGPTGPPGATGPVGASGLLQNYVAKATSSTAITSSKLFDDGVNVGVGTASPAAAFDLSAPSVSGSGNAPAFNVVQTWNTTGTPTLIKANVTDTASNANSLLMDLQVGGTSQFQVLKTGAIVLPYAYPGIVDGSNNSQGTNYTFNGPRLGPDALIGWTAGGPNATPDLRLHRDAANTLAQRNAGNAQTFRIYNSFTNASNYERGKLEWSSNVLRIGTEKAGTGSARALELQTDGTTRVTISTAGQTTFSTRATIDTLTVGLGGQTSVATNMAVGFQALNSASLTGAYNTAIGYQSLINNTTGSNNSAVGLSVLFSNTTGSNNSAVGASALFSNNTGSNNSAVGVNSLTSNTIGNANSAMGAYALFGNTTGYNNSAIGASALQSNTTGFSNVAVGVNALFSNTTGNNNSAIGVGALVSNTTGNYNSAIGVSALNSNTTGNDNSAIGVVALHSNTTGSYNIAVGWAALGVNTTSSYNVAVGAAALYASTGLANIAIGFQAADNLTAGDGNIVIGHNLDAPSATGSNQINIGNQYYHNQLYLFNSGSPFVANYERGKLEWSSNVFKIGTEKAGTGSARALELQTDGTTRVTIASGGAVTITGNTLPTTTGTNGQVLTTNGSGTLTWLNAAQESIHPFLLGGM